jgi:hypothetical protein
MGRFIQRFSMAEVNFTSDLEKWKTRSTKQGGKENYRSATWFPNEIFRQDIEMEES